MIGIYKITNPKGKVYIGQSINIEERMLKYKYLNSNSIGAKLLNSFKKYGWETHKFEVIELCDLPSLPQKEKYWIKYYNSISEGLNIIEGGSTVGFKSKKVRDRISESWNKKSQKEKDIINEKRRVGNLGKSKPGAGCKNFTPEHRKKISDSSKGKPKISNRKSVLMLDKNTYKILKEFNSVTEAAAFIKVKQPTLSGCLLGHSQTSGGFRWKYKS